MEFDLLINTPITLNGETHLVRFYNGMSGIGSREFWIDDKRYDYGAVRQSADLTKGNHFLYKMKWRDTPWDWVYIFIHEDELSMLLNEDNKWREPKKIELRPQK